MPDPRSRAHQKTCGRAECRREWHRKKCAEWNGKHRAHYKAIYLGKKLAKCRDEVPPLVTELAPPGRIELEVPRREVQEVTGAKLLVVIEYFVQLLLKRVQEGKRAEVVENKAKNSQVLTGSFQEGMDKGERMGIGSQYVR